MNSAREEKARSIGVAPEVVSWWVPAAAGVAVPRGGAIAPPTGTYRNHLQTGSRIPFGTRNGQGFGLLLRTALSTDERAVAAPDRSRGSLPRLAELTEKKDPPPASCALPSLDVALRRHDLSTDHRGRDAEFEARNRYRLCIHPCSCVCGECLTRPRRPNGCPNEANQNRHGRQANRDRVVRAHAGGIKQFAAQNGVDFT